MSNTNKVKVSATDLQHFPLESLQVNPYWDDLYNPKKSKKTKRSR